MYEQELKEKKNEIFFILMFLIIIILIITIFLLVRNLGFINDKPKIPTGNIDIFDIIFEQNNNCNCNCDSCNKNNCNNCTDLNKCISNNCNNNNYSSSNYNNNNSNNNGNNSNSGNNGNEISQPDKESGIEVFDKETEYSKNTTLNIFTNTTYYVVDDKIAPLTENSYQFIIRNHNDFNIKYNLELNEENFNKINMKYRLKLNDEYVSGDNETWLTYDELKQDSIVLSANNYDVYTLDWKWFESENDTEVGTSINSDYKLKLKITAFEN